MENGFDSLDYFDLEELLTAEERLIRDSVRQFVDDRVLPIIGDCFTQGRFPRELIPELAGLGLLGASLEGYGCSAIGPVAYGLVLQELERGDAAIRSFVSVQGSLAMYAIHAFGSEEQKTRWLLPMARGEKIGCFGLTEPDHGSNPAGMLTRAVRQGDHFVLNGSKMWITNGSIADVAVVWAREVDTADGGASGGEGVVRGYLVERADEGFTATHQSGKWSLCASDTSALHFDDCRIPLDRRLPDGERLRAPLACLSQARYGIAWGALGAAMACYTTALEYARSRVQFGKPIASFQLIQEKLVEMLREITKGQLLAYRLGRIKEQRAPRPQQVSLAKMNNVAIALDVARSAREILGANGIMHEYCIGRHMMNLETLKTYEGTHQIHTLILGQDITGFGAFS